MRERFETTDGGESDGCPESGLHNQVLAQAACPGVDMSGARIPSARTSEEVAAPPPTYWDALRFRQGEICDALAARDRWIFHGVRTLAYRYVGRRWAVHMEPRTAPEAALLADIEDILPAGGGVQEMGNFGATAQQMQALRAIEGRGRRRNLGAVTAVTAVNVLVDRVLYPSDHIKIGTLTGDLLGLAIMCPRIPWTWKVAGMAAAHAGGRIWDHFLQGDEPTNAHLSLFNPSARLEAGLRALDRRASPATAGAVPALPGSTGDPARDKRQAELDSWQRQMNAARQLRDEQAALERFLAWQEAFRLWRLQNPDATSWQESQFMRRWWWHHRPDVTARTRQEASCLTARLA